MKKLVRLIKRNLGSTQSVLQKQKRVFLYGTIIYKINFSHPGVSANHFDEPGEKFKLKKKYKTEVEKVFRGVEMICTLGFG